MKDNGAVKAALQTEIDALRASRAVVQARLMGLEAEKKQTLDTPRRIAASGWLADYNGQAKDANQ